MDEKVRKVKEFWEKNPVAAPDEEWGSYEYFRKFDNVREADDCEPWDFSNRIHGYDRSKGKRVLDIGCGNGYVLSQYAKFGAETRGIDLTETAVSMSRKRFQLLGYPGEFELTDGLTIPYPDDHFDIVCSMGVLHHIPDPSPMIGEARRVLKSGGRLILMLYNRDSFRNRVAFRLYRLLSKRYHGMSIEEIRNTNDGWGCPLAMAYGKDDVRTLLRGFSNITFTVNKLSWNELFVYPPLGRLMTRLLPGCSESPLAKRWGWNLYVSAVKP